VRLTTRQFLAVYFALNVHHISDKVLCVRFFVPQLNLEL
jgi:hypothetical protein